ncbi:MAG: hypothetical protein ACE5JX_23335, partial [Acidobacteriota bacterium]
KPPKVCNRVHGFAEITTQFRVCYKAQDVFSSNANDQVAVQMALAVRELLYRFWTMFESGDGSLNSNEFDGLAQLVDPANVLDLKGGPLTLEVLDLAKERVRTNDGRCVTIFTSGVGKRAIHAAHWVRGLDPEYQEMEFPCPGGEFKAEKVLTFDGAAVHVNDLNEVRTWKKGQPGKLIAPEDLTSYDGPSPATNIWFFVLGEGNLHGIKPANAMDIITRSTILADASTLVYHLAMPVGIALGSAASLSVIKNASIPGP